MILPSQYKLTTIISTVRHGEKDPLGTLTQVGFEQAKAKGKNTEFLGGNILIFHSGIKRVSDTVHNLAENLSNKNPHIDVQMNSFPSHYLQYLYDPKIKGILFSHWDDSTSEEEHLNKINNFLNLRDTSTEKEIFPSPKHMAIRLARILATEIDLATITASDVMNNIINGTHEPVLMSFLYYFLQDYVPATLDFIHRIGGSVDFAEGFEIYIYQTKKGNNKVYFKFRNIEKELDQIRMKEFCLSEEEV